MALGYKVALTNVWWNRGGQDTRLFSSVAEQQTYFTNKGLYYNDLVNFNIKDNITTTIVFRDKSGRGAEELLKCNYAVVWNTKANTYRYYFIVSIEQDSSNQVIASLDLDDVNTNLVPNLSNIGNVFVNTWTGKNYRAVGNIKAYDLASDNLSYLDEGNSPTQYNIGTSEVLIKQYEHQDLDEWLHENILAWKYVFCVENNQLIGFAYDNFRYVDYIQSACYINSDGKNLDKLPYCSIAVPYYKTDKHIYIRYYKNNTPYYVKLTTSALGEFFTASGQFYNDGPTSSNAPMGTYGFEEKISNICPLDINSYEISGGDLIIEGELRPSPSHISKDILWTGDYTSIYMTRYTATDQNIDKNTAPNVVVSGYCQENTTYNCEAYHNFDILNAPTNGNVKILDKEYSRLRLRFANQHYDYNPIACITSTLSAKVNILYTEILKAGLSKVYVRLAHNGLYTEAQEYDYTGLIASLDLTEPILTNQWADYFASHKNYYMQTGFNNSISLLKSGANAGLSTFFNYSKGNNERALGSLIFGGASGLIDFASRVINQELDKDNMLQAPDSLSNANGDPYFYTAVSGIKPKLDTYQVKSNTKESLLDNWARNGVVYNRKMDFNTILFSHESYEALACIIYKVDSNLSTKEFARLREFMANNHRYWHIDNFTDFNPYILP